MKVAAKLAGLSEEEFVALNPAHNKPVAAGTGVFIVPVDKADDFKANLERYDQPLVSWTTYQARRYESLDAIARHHHTTAAHLKAANDGLKLDKKGQLRVAAAVMVPIGREPNAPIRVAQVTAVQPTAARVAAPVREAPPAAMGAKTHTVRAGDTLYAFEEHYRAPVDALIGVNGLS